MIDKTKKYIESGKRVIAFSIVWLIIVLIWNYTIGINIKIIPRKLLLFKT